VALNSYLTQTQALLHDPNAQAYSTTDLTRYINLARSQIAIEGECCRALLTGGTVVNLTISSGGSGYSGTPTFAFTGGAQTFASGTIVAGSVATVTILSGGWGYIPASGFTCTATGSNGSGTNATFAATIDNSATTVTGQEVVPFQTLNQLLAAWNTNSAAYGTGPMSQFVGLNQIIKVFSLACNQAGTYKPILTEKIWSEFQAYLRIYANTQQNYPTYWSQYGQGVNGSLYLFPWPAQPLQLDVDACCTPIALVNDSTVEAIPYPFTDAIPYYAAYLAYENSSRKEDANRMLGMYTVFMKRARALSEHPFMPDYYGYEY